MKLLDVLLIASIALTSFGIANAQQRNPFAPKGNPSLPAEQPVVARAIVSKVHSAVTLNTATGTATPNYRVIIGNDLYWTTGVGPSSGIYDAEVYQNFIHIKIEHSGVKPIEIYHLHIDLIQHNQAESRLAPSTPQPEIVDGRRLIIYDRTIDQSGNVHFRAVAIDRTTGVETYFIFSAYAPSILPGIYDFKLFTVEKQNYLDLLTNPKGAGPMWIRLGLDAYNVVDENNAANRVANRKAYEKQ